MMLKSFSRRYARDSKMLVSARHRTTQISEYLPPFQNVSFGPQWQRAALARIP
jgi:hypothetical protein